MKRLLWLALVVGVVSMAASTNPAVADMDDGSKITIVSPKHGAKVGDTFDLTYELVKGSKAEHAHVYLDGQPQKKFSGTFKGLSKGAHEITVQAATHDHDHVGASDTITVEVQ